MEEKAKIPMKTVVQMDRTGTVRRGFSWGDKVLGDLVWSVCEGRVTWPLRAICAFSMYEILVGIHAGYT